MRVLAFFWYNGVLIYNMESKMIFASFPPTLSTINKDFYSLYSKFAYSHGQNSDSVSIYVSGTVLC